MPPKPIPPPVIRPSKKRLADTVPRHLNDGFVPVTREDVTDLALLPKRFDLFAADVKQSFEILAGKILPLLNEMRDEQKQHRQAISEHAQRLAYLERTKGAHAEMLTEHETKHTQHTETTTGLHKRLVLVEETIITKHRPKGKRK